MTCTARDLIQQINHVEIRGRGIPADRQDLQWPFPGNHYKSRAFINEIAAGTSTELFLDETDGWSRTSLDETARSHKFRDREVFVGLE